MRQRAGQHLVFLDRDVVLLGHLDDLRAERSPALGDHTRRAAAFVIVEGDGDLILGLHTHRARSRKWPAGAGFGCGGAPSRMTISPGCNSAPLNA